MNAALIAACAANSRMLSEYQTVYIHHEKVERPIIGMIKIENNRDAVIVNDCVMDGVELRFRSVLEVNDLMRKLDKLRQNMLVLEGIE